MLVAWILNALALAFGAGLGARALLDPRWAAKFARVQADEQGGGFAEFRATYGGVFAFGHAMALILTLAYLLGGTTIIGVAATGAAAVLGAAWLGSAFGRGLAIVLDGVRTKFNAYCAIAEVGLALAIGAPWILWLIG